MDRMRRCFAAAAVLLALAAALPVAAGSPGEDGSSWLEDLWGRVAAWFTGPAVGTSEEGPDIDPNGAASPPQVDSIPAGAHDEGPDIDPNG